jgi:hypothetical protein
MSFDSNHSRSLSAERWFGLAAALLAILVLLFSCADKKSNPFGAWPYPPPEVCRAEQWDADTGGWYAYTHDCHPYQGEHFTVYSDGSSRTAKEQLAGLAEEKFDHLVPEFLITDIAGELELTEGSTYYIYADQNHDPIQAMGYRHGFFIGAIDCHTVPNYYTRDPWWYGCIIQHELTHVFQFTLTGCPSNDACPYWLGVWFREGQAVYMCGAGPGIRITSLVEFRQWWEDEDHVNPISIHRWTDFPDPDRGGEYYPMFGLAYAYLIDRAEEQGAGMAEMRNLFQLMKEGQGFMEAFEEALDMSVADYQENFYTMMETYLGQTGQESSRSLEEKMALWEGGRGCRHEE